MVKNRERSSTASAVYKIFSFNPGLAFKISRLPLVRSAMAHHAFDSRSHSTLLSASLENLQLSGHPQKIVPHQEHGANDNEDVINEFHPQNLIENIIDSHKAVGKPTKANSARSSPPATGVESPIPDPNGLGWPGACRKRT